MFFFLAGAALALTQAATPPIGQRTTTPAQMLAGMGNETDPAAEDEAAAAAAARFPLGSIENPIRVGGPNGERDYLARLRCADGSRPTIGNRREGGVGGFGSIVASYPVQCAGAASADVALDMYHEEHRENRAPAGFTLGN